MYNPDGSAYILEESSLLAQLPRQAGAIVDNEDTGNNQVCNLRVEVLLNAKNKT